MNAYRLTNKFNIKWIRPFKFVRLPTKFLSIYTFAKRGPGDIENLQEVKCFQTHLKSRWNGRWKLEHNLKQLVSNDLSTLFIKNASVPSPSSPHKNTLAFRRWKTNAAFWRNKWKSLTRRKHSNPPSHTHKKEQLLSQYVIEFLFATT